MKKDKIVKRVRKNHYLKFLARYCKQRNVRFLEAYYDNEYDLVDCYYVNGDNVDGLFTFKASDFS